MKKHDVSGAVKYSVLNKINPYKGKFGALHNHSKKIRCLTNGKVYGAVREASRELGIDNGTICAQMNGKLKHAKGMHFKYEEA